MQGVIVIDEDDQGQPFDLLFLNANVPIGTLNSPVSVSDANARAIIGRVQVVSGDYSDLGGVRVARPALSVLEQLLKSGQDIYVAGVSRGTGTYTAAGLKVTISAEPYVLIAA